LAWAKDLGLDVNKFQKDLDDPANDGLGRRRTWPRARSSASMARRRPSSMVVCFRGAQPFPAFKAIIDEELNKKS
jgi:hypothetical protein